MEIKLTLLSIAFSLILLLGFFIFYLVHYMILQKLLNEKFPFEPSRLKHIAWLKSRNNKHAYLLEQASGWKKHNAPIYGYACFISIPVTMLFNFAYYYYKGKANILLKPFIQTFFNSLNLLLFFYALTLTIGLLIFSKTVFNKPRKETALAVIIAGIVGYAVLFGYNYGIFKLLPLLKTYV